MKIFIFEPYKWDYCGGSIVAIAKDYNSVIKLINKHLEKDHKRGKWSFPFTPHQFYKEDIGPEGTDQWILSEELILKDENQKSRVVLENWNFG